MKLCIGVIPLPEPSYSGTSSATTYTVAKRLEDAYGLFSHFAVDNLDQMTRLLTKNIQTSLHRHIEGESENTDTFDTAPNEITGMFKTYLDTQALDNRESGVPTRAAMLGKRRLKGPEFRGPPRPSFEDTFTLYGSLRTWVEK